MFGFKKRDPLAGLDTFQEEGSKDSFDMPPTQEQTGIPPEMPVQQNTEEPFSTPNTFDQVKEVQQPKMEFTQQQQAPPVNVRDKDMELISSKLDVVKALLENLSQRMSTLEQKLDTKNKGW